MIIMRNYGVEEEEKKSEYEKIKKEREYTFMEDEAKMTSNQFFFCLVMFELILLEFIFVHRGNTEEDFFM